MLVAVVVVVCIADSMYSSLLLFEWPGGCEDAWEKNKHPNAPAKEHHGDLNDDDDDDGNYFRFEHIHIADAEKQREVIVGSHKKKL